MSLSLKDKTGMTRLGFSGIATALCPERLLTVSANQEPAALGIPENFTMHNMTGRDTINDTPDKIGHYSDLAL